MGSEKGIHSQARLDPRTLLLATRPWSFAMTAVSVTAGTLMAVPVGFSWGPYLVTLVGMIFVHAATNLVNDYFDVRHGVDHPDAPTARYRPHPLVEGALRPGQVLGVSLALYGIALLIGLYLASLRGWSILVLALLGGLASFSYTAGPVQYKHRGLGEISVFLMWGPLMTAGAFFVQTGSWRVAPLLDVLWVSVPVGLWVALVLLANNLKDIDYDRRMGVTTLATTLGREGALKLLEALVIVIYLLTGAAVWAGALPTWSILVLLSVPKAFQLIRSLERAPQIPADADPRTAQLSTLYGILLLASILLGHPLPL